MNCKCCGAWFSSSDASQELCAGCRRALERVSPIIESLSAELEQAKQERDGLNIMLGQAQSMLETRTRERDAAIEDINLIQSNEVSSCEICKYNHNGCYKRCDFGNRCFEWRGVQEGDNAGNN